MNTSANRFLLTCAAAAAVLCVVCVFAVDGRVAMAVASTYPSDLTRWVRQATTVFEVAFAFRVTPYLYGALMIAAGAAMWRKRRTSLWPGALLFVGSSHATARFLVDVLKPPFSRLRPYQASVDGTWHDTFFAPVGNSFPSGHAVHVWSLFFPLAVLFPRYRIPLLILPVLVSAARVVVNDHYVGDVLASAAIAALVTWGYETVLIDARRQM